MRKEHLTLFQQSSQILRYRPVPSTVVAIKKIMFEYLGSTTFKYKVIVDHERFTVTFKFPFPTNSSLVRALEDVRPAGTGFLFDRLGSFECWFKRQQWVEK